MAPYNEMAQRLINVPNTEAVGGQFRKDGYALGLRKGSPFTQKL
ncbi:hypothetical protein TrispH2_012141, partial [Trichoplax sp. H2]